MNTPIPREQLLARGYCCGLGCRHCPYRDKHGKKHQKGETNIDKTDTPQETVDKK